MPSFHKACDISSVFIAFLVHINLLFPNAHPDDDDDDKSESGSILNRTSSQSYIGSMIVNYDSRVVIWGIFQSGTTLES